MAEAEQRARLAIAQSESLVATDLAREEMGLQTTVMRRRLNLEALGTWLGFATTIVVIGAALIFAVYAPEKIEKIGALMIGFAYAAAQVIAAFRRSNGSSKGKPSDSPDPKETPPRKRKR